MPCYVVPATTQELAADPLDPSQVVSGNPQVSTYELLETEALAVGIWQHTAGVSTDVEVDEIFVVLAGRATIEVAGARPCRWARRRRRPRGRGRDHLDHPRGPAEDLHHPRMTAATPPGHVLTGTSRTSGPSSATDCYCFPPSRCTSATNSAGCSWSTRSTASSGELSAAQSSPVSPPQKRRFARRVRRPGSRSS